jgi:diacylglycerol diphosphate phosphatase/phosphatidate phosphatase
VCHVSFFFRTHVIVTSPRKETTTTAAAAAEEWLFATPPVAAMDRCYKAVPWFAWSHVADWLVGGVMLAVAGAFEFAPTYQTVIPDSSDNAAFDYPWQADTVPMWLLGLACYLVPIVLFVSGQALLRLGLGKRGWGWHRMLHDVHHALLGLWESAALALLITQTVKPFAGRIRPHFFARLAEFGEHAEADARRSFPSGHSSMAFAGLMMLALWIAGKLRVARTGQLYRALLAGVPLYGAFLICVSRTRDYHHHFSDIIAGGLIGIFSGITGYFLNYPSLFDSRCHIPNSRRTETSSETATTVTTVTPAELEEAKPK